MYEQVLESLQLERRRAEELERDKEVRDLEYAVRVEQIEEILGSLQVGVDPISAEQISQITS